MAASSRNTVMKEQHGTLAPFLTGLAAAAALTAGIGLLLYTGLGFLRTAGMLVGVTLLALAAGIWAGDDASRSTRLRALALLAGFLVANVFTAWWSASETFRMRPEGGALAVLLMLAMPSYATGTLIAGLQRHASRNGTRGIGTEALAGAAVGVFITTTFLVAQYDAWVIFFGAALLMLHGVAYPAAGGAVERTTGGSMTGRVVIVTGVSHAGQLGFAVAQRFVADGARVIVSGYSDEVRGLAERLGARTVSAGIRADLTRDDEVAALLQSAAAWGRLDALINVAGGLSVTGTVADTEPEAFSREMARNAETMLRTSRAALPMLRESRGAIVNFASAAGERAVHGLGAYSAAKAAVIALTRALALEELEHGVRVNAIAPGLIDTEQNRASSAEGAKFVTREQVAEAVLFLAGDAGRGVTGETLHVAGDTLE